jgi:hypothetical protein
MLQNLQKLENNHTEILDPSLLFEKNIIFTKKSKDIENIKMQDYSWWNTFDNIDLNSIFRSIIKIHEEFVLSLGIEKLR